ncbi:MAG: HD domain-containing protein, partial [Clostridia bacterium]|nr:HD domain-containing protein [Clostridia bacterium]
HIIITCAYIGMMFVCVSLSFHVVIMLTMPTLMVGQYRYDKKLTRVIMAATVLLVPISVYGSFFFGVPDRNLIKGMLTDEEAKLLVNRIKIATPKRMLDLLTHYVFPRAMGTLAVEFLLFGIAKRNQSLLDGQKELADVAQREMERRNDLQKHVIDDLAGVIETRDIGTGEHVIRTKKYIDIIARELQKHDEYKDVLTDEVIRNIEAAAPLHDVGKIAISDTILLKPGKLTNEEFEIMKQHSQKGGEMIENIFVNLDDKAFLDKAYNIAMFHHEKWDGSGYPQRRAGGDIPLEARLMAIADVYDALVSRRVYKESMPAKEAFKVIIDGAGTHFDPNIIELIAPLEDEFIRAAHEPINRDKK